MKKNLLGWFAMATMLVGTGCSSDEVVNDYSPENAIQFGTYVGRDAESRGSIITTDGGEGYQELTSFGVFAFYRDEGATVSSPNFMNNQIVEKKTSNWTYSPVKYWPNESSDVIDFYAYAPHIDGKNWENNCVQISVPKELSEQIDYLVAAPQCDKKKSDETVTFTFAHAMSRVGFKVEAVIEDDNHQEDGVIPDEDNQKTEIATGTVISVQEVKLIGNFYKSANLNLVGQNWDYSSAAYYNETPVEYILNSGNFNENVANQVTIAKQPLNKLDSYLMLIPRTFTKEDPIQVYVKYTVTTTDEALPGKCSVVENKITSLPFAFDFKQNNAYDFVLHLGLKSVKLSATVTEWEKEIDDVVVNVPIN